MSDIKILIADDEERMRRLLKDVLVRKGYAVVEAADGEEALEKFYADKDIALLILDVMMPKKDGFQVLTEIRRESKVPVLMLTAKTEEQDELAGFRLGADDYVPKPFSLSVLTARVDALLKRSNALGNDTLEAGGIVLDRRSHTVKVDGEEIELSFKEFELLTYFLENQGVALTREKILNHVWNYDYYGDARTIDTHVKKLRSKLRGKQEYIRTVWGVGYKFEVTP